jgi:hypothetical protein
MPNTAAKRWFVSGTVQGALKELAAALHLGPPMSHVRGVEEREEAIDSCNGFVVR